MESKRSAGFVLTEFPRLNMDSKVEMEALREALAAARRESDDLRAWREDAIAEHEEQLRRLRG